MFLPRAILHEPPPPRLSPPRRTGPVTQGDRPPATDGPASSARPPGTGGGQTSPSQETELRPDPSRGEDPETRTVAPGARSQGFLHRSAFWLVCGGFLLYTLVWSYLSELRLFALRASVYDLGIFVEQGWQIHATDYSTTALVYEFFRFGGTLVFWPVTLGGLGFMLVFQSALLGLGGVLVYLTARAYRLDPPTSLGLSVVYFLYFPLAGVNFNDYHLEAFLIPLFLAGYLLFLKGRFLPAFLLLLLCGLLWYPLGIYPALFGLLVGGASLASAYRTRQSRKPSGPSARATRFPVGHTLVRWVSDWRPFPAPRSVPGWFPVGLLLGGVGLLAGGAIVVPKTPALVSALAAAHGLTLTPGADLPLKAFTLFLLFVPLAFLPLLSPRWLVFDLPFLALVVAADYYGYVFPGIATDWHVFLVIPFLFLGAIEGVARIRSWGSGWAASGPDRPPVGQPAGALPAPEPFPRPSRPPRARRGSARHRAADLAVACALGATLVCGAYLTPYGPFNSGTAASFQSSELFQYNATLYQDLMTLIHLIPPSNPSVVFQDNMPELLPRPFLPDATGPLVPGPFDGVAYNLTYPTPFGGWRSFLPDYVIGDPVPLPDTFFGRVGTFPFNISLEQILDELYGTGQYGTLGEAQGMWLIARNYSGPLRVYVPFQQAYLPSAFLAPLGQMDPPGCAAPCLGFSNLDQGQVAWYGPYTYLAPGSYRATFDLSLQGWNASSSVTLDVTSHSGKFVLASQVLRPTTSGTGPLRLSLPFNLTDGAGGVEFRAIDSHFQGELTLSSVSVQEIAPPR